MRRGEIKEEYHKILRGQLDEVLEFGMTGLRNGTSNYVLICSGDKSVIPVHMAYARGLCIKIHNPLAF